MTSIKILILLFVSFMVLGHIGIASSAQDDTGKIDIVDREIKIDNSVRPSVAYLFATFKNNSDKKVVNLTLQMEYFDEYGCLIKRKVAKDVLNDPIKKGEIRKYRIRLKGDIVNIENEQYPYSEEDRVSDYTVKILRAKFANK